MYNSNYHHGLVVCETGVITTWANRITVSLQFRNLRGQETVYVRLSKELTVNVRK